MNHRQHSLAVITETLLVGAAINQFNWRIV